MGNVNSRDSKRNGKFLPPLHDKEKTKTDHKETKEAKNMDASKDLTQIQEEAGTLLKKHAQSSSKKSP